MAPRDRRVPGGFRAAVLAILVHLLVGGVLVAGWRWSDTPTAPAAETIKAVVVDDPEKARLEDELRRIEEEERRKKAQAERDRVEAEERRQQEQRIALQKQKAEAERKRLEDAKRKQAEAEKLKAEAEKLKQEAQKKQDQERQRKADEESLKEQILAEERARSDSTRSTRISTERDRFKALIERRVYDSWSVPTGLPVLKCRVGLRLLPGGVITDLKIVQSSGNTAFDRSVEAAVRKASPFPVPSDPEVFEELRDIEFIISNAKR